MNASRFVRLLVSLTFLSLIACGQKPTSIDLQPGSLALSQAGATESIKATVKDAKGEPMEGVVTWASSDPKVATVNVNGAVTAVATGDARVTAKIGEVTANADVKVTIAKTIDTASEIAFKALGETVAITATVMDELMRPMPDAVIVWTSEDPSVVSVAGATVTAVAFGITTLRGQVGSASSSVAVVVEGPQPATLALSTMSVNIKVGASEQLVAIVTAESGEALTGSPVVWISKDPAIATVDATGLVQGVKRGQTVVTAQLGALETQLPVKIR